MVRKIIKNMNDLVFAMSVASPIMGNNGLKPAKITAQNITHVF